MRTETEMMRLGTQSSASRDVERRFEAIDGLLDAEAAIARHEIAEAETDVENAAKGSLGLKVAGFIARRDLSKALTEGAAARLGGANDAAAKIAKAVSSLRGAQGAVHSAEDAGADPFPLVSVDGFWPEGDAHELPDLDRLAVVGAAIMSRCSAFKAAARARARVLEEGRETVSGLERARDTAMLARDRAERDGAFGELADRDRMLLGVPGVRRPVRQRPLWKVAPPRFHAKDEPFAREKHARGVETFLKMLESAYPDSGEPVVPSWPPSETDRRTLAVSYRYGSKLARGAVGPNWNREEKAYVLPRDQRALDAHPNQLPLISTLEGRTALASIPFVPVPTTAANLNMHELFTPATWDAITGNLVAMRGDRCSICGTTCGHMNRNGWFGEIQKPGLEASPSTTRRIEVHEVWDFKEREDGVGVQKLVSLLPVCTDCHMVFHLDQVKRDAAGFAARAEIDVGRCTEAAIDYVLDRRAAMLEGVTEFPHLSAIYMAEAESDLAGRLTEGVAKDKWVADLSGMRLLNLAGGDPVMRANANPDLIAGLAVVDGQGDAVPAASVERRALDITAAPPEQAPSELEDRIRMAWG